MATAGELTRTMQSYLRYIYELGRDGGEVTGWRLLERLGVRHASVTNMLKRLEALGLVRREPYQRVRLTAEGALQALWTTRHHRLVELYLLELLGYSQKEVYGEAEQTSHRCL